MGLCGVTRGLLFVLVSSDGWTFCNLGATIKAILFFSEMLQIKVSFFFYFIQPPPPTRTKIPVGGPTVGGVDSAY